MPGVVLTLTRMVSSKKIGRLTSEIILFRNPFFFKYEIVMFDKVGLLSKQGLRIPHSNCGSELQSEVHHGPSHKYKATVDDNADSINSF